jgi:hypothetical protein
MASRQQNHQELVARKAMLEQRLAEYRTNLSTVTGPCSKSSMRRLIEECEIALEEVCADLGETKP